MLALPEVPCNAGEARAKSEGRANEGCPKSAARDSIKAGAA
jgi:hypothetical protein